MAAIRAISRGESLIHPSVASKILAEFSLLAEGKSKKRGVLEHDLTDREITVLRLVADGKTNKEIANVLDLSEKTVKNHVRNIFHKLHVYDRTQAAILAIRKGIIELEPKAVVEARSQAPRLCSQEGGVSLSSSPFFFDSLFSSLHPHFVGWYHHQ